MDELKIRPAQRVEACIADVMARFPDDSKDYYVEVHQHLAPLARELERENDRLRAELASRGAGQERTTSIGDDPEFVRLRDAYCKALFGNLKSYAEAKRALIAHIDAWGARQAGEVVAWQWRHRLKGSTGWGKWQTVSKGRYERRADYPDSEFRELIAAAPAPGKEE